MLNKASVAIAAALALASSPVAAGSSFHGGQPDTMGGSHPSNMGSGMGAPADHGSVPPGPGTMGSGANMAGSHGSMPPGPSTGGGMHHHHHHFDDDDFFFFGWPFFPYPDPYFVYARAPASESPNNQYWYYCPNSKSYYPWVKTCEGEWEPVPASPPPPPPSEN
jgi:hypothetical protein